MFVNITNHPHENWSLEQIEAAREYGEIIDIVFPSVPPDASEADVDTMAEDLFRQVICLKPDIVMCQGEMTLAFRVVERLKSAGIKTVAACSERHACETYLADGSTQKSTVFLFKGFRAY